MLDFSIQYPICNLCNTSGSLVWSQIKDAAMHIPFDAERGETNAFHHNLCSCNYRTKTILLNLVPFIVHALLLSTVLVYNCNGIDFIFSVIPYLGVHGGVSVPDNTCIYLVVSSGCVCVNAASDQYHMSRRLLAIPTHLLKTLTGQLFGCLHRFHNKTVYTGLCVCILGDLTETTHFGCPFSKGH